MRMAQNHQDPVARIHEQTSHRISPGSDTVPQSPHPSPGVQLTGGNRQIRPTHVSIFNRLLDQFRHRLVAVNHVMRAAGKIGDSGLVRIDAHVVIEGRVHFTKMHGPIGNRGA